MSKRLRFTKWVAAFQRGTRRHEAHSGLAVHHRRLACEGLEDRRLLSLGGELAGVSTVQPKSLTDLPVAAQYAVSSAIGQDQAAYHAAAGAAGLTLANPANNFSAEVRSGMLQVAAGSDTWSLALHAFGYGDVLETVATPQVSSAGNRVDCDYGAIDEWFINGPGGLQQGFVIDPSAQPDAVDTGATLTVALDIGGDLRATVNAAGDGLELARPDGSAALSYAGLTAYDSTGRTLPASMEVRGSEADQDLLIHVDTAGAQGPITVDPFVQRAKLTASNAANWDRFGYSVALSGNTIVVGAYGTDSERGTVYLFQRPSTGWANATETARLTATDGSLLTQFGYSVAIDGDTVVVGARSGSLNGAAYIYQKPSTGWRNMTEIAQLLASDGTSGYSFGTSVAISGDTVVVGAPNANVGPTTSPGAIYVFQKPSSGWVTMHQTVKLATIDPDTFDDFGTSVAISGNTAVASAPGNLSSRGAAYVFEAPSSGWTLARQVAKLTASDGAANDQLGTSIAISGNTVVVGARYAENSAGRTTGAAYVYVRPSDGWKNATESAKLTPSAAEAPNVDDFGISVAISGYEIVVGALHTKVGSQSAQGAAYVFHRPSTGWASVSEIAKLTASDGAMWDDFGFSVAMDGATIAVGAQSSPWPSYLGSAYVFQSYTVAWPAPTAITYGTALDSTQLNAAASLPGTFSYTPSAGAVVGAGIRTLSALFTPTDADHYNVSTERVTLVVNQATPTISWSPPADIAYGTKLSTAQLNASASWTVGGTLDDVPGTYEYLPPAGTTLGVGTHTLSVTFTPADSANYTQSTTSVTITVNKAAPVITWANPAAISYGTPLDSTQLNAVASVPGQYVYMPPVGSILGAGNHTLSVTFTPNDRTRYIVTTASVTITVDKAAPAVNWPTPTPITYGTRLSATQLNATANVPGSFVYSPAIGALLDAGSPTLSAIFTPTDTVNYSTVATDIALRVNKATPVMDWPTPAPITFPAALSAAQLNASASWTVGEATGPVAGTFAYTPAAGQVLDPGSHFLSTVFTPTDTANYMAASANVTLDVQKARPTITWASPAAITYGTALGVTQLDATADVPGIFRYAPPLGTVLLAGTRTLSVTFTPDDGASYDETTASVTIQVQKATPAIRWEPSSITYGTALGAAQLNATASWSVGGTPKTVAGSFAYTPNAGTVLDVGSHTLSAVFTPTDSANYNTATTDVTLQVNPAVPAITWANPAAITYGTPLGVTQLDAAASVPGSFVYTPDFGVVLEGGSHTLSVVFTPTDTTNYTTATANVTLLVNPALPTITWANPAAITYGTLLGDAQLNAVAGVPGSFEYSPGVGAKLAAGSRTLRVTFRPSDTVNYATTTAQVTIQVDKALPAVQWSDPAAITYGTALTTTQLAATANIPGTYAYAPAAGTVLGAGSRTLAVTFTPSDPANYLTATASVPLQVDKATPSLAWTTPAAIVYGTALDDRQLNAAARWSVGGIMGSVAGDFAYTPAAGTVLAAGNHNLAVTFTPADTADYNTATANVSLRVDKATPTINWPTPQAIAYGTPLGGTQLNASALWTVGGTQGSVAGTYSYTPIAGTVLEVGNRNLSLVFTPADTADYNTATANVVLQVNKATPLIDWAAPAAITYGTALGNTQLNATANVPGSFLYTPSAGTVLGAGIRTLSVTFTPSDTAHYAAATANVALQVDKATPSIVVTAYSVTYDGMPHTAVGTAHGVKGEDLTSWLNLGGTTHTNAGDYADDSWTFAGGVNYTSPSGTVGNKIDKANAGVEVLGYAVTYDGHAHTAAGTAHGVRGEDLSAQLNLSGTTHTDAGAYNDSWSFDGGTNYNSRSDTVASQIAKADATIAVTPYVVTYDGQAHAAAGTALGVRNEDLSAQLNLSGTTHTDAGAYNDSWSFDGGKNYNSRSDAVANQIAKADATITVTPYSVTYDGQAHTAAGTALGVRNEDLSAQLNLSGTTHTDAGSYNDTWSFDGGRNYNSPEHTLTNSIAKADATITVAPYSVTYDGQAHTAVGTARGVKGDDLTSWLDLSGTTHTDAGSYNDTWSFAGGKNYNSPEHAVTNRIAKADATIRVEDYSGAYDAQPHGPAATITGVQGESLLGAWHVDTMFTSVPGGTAHWTFDGGGNYNPASGTASVAIAPNTKMGPEIVLTAVSPNPAKAAPKLTAKATTANTGNAKIVAAEYFVDKPGKNGKGTAMAASDRRFNSPTESLAATIRALFGKLRQGTHTLYVHAKDAKGKWGPFTPVAFAKDSIGPVTSRPSVTPSPANAAPTLTATISDASTAGSTVVAAEYFIDKQGVSGKGTPITAAFDSATQTVAAVLNAAAFNRLKQGAHRIYIHGKDAAGNWGKFATANFVKDTRAPATSQVKVNPSAATTPPTLTAKIDDKSTGASILAAAEYFLDTPGPAGAGILIPVAANKVAQTVTAVLDPALFQSLSEGLHTVYVRAKDAAGNWGNTQYAAFEKTSAAKPAVSASPRSGFASLQGAAAADEAILGLGQILGWGDNGNGPDGSSIA